ncbi:hypothetical protein QUF56_18070 [Ureibacillus composti]|nr:hypothetical protein [Ureibacillus composti]
MGRKIAIAVFSIFLFAGCSQQQTFESFFHKKMEEIHFGEEEYSYKLVHKEFNIVYENDAIAVFKENDELGEKVFIAYLEKVDNQWQWMRTRGSEWNSQVKWKSMNQSPFIYSGAINDRSITEVFAGDEPAKIINVDEGKRFWYAISPTNDVEVMIVKDDGSKEIVKEINYSELQNK